MPTLPNIPSFIACRRRRVEEEGTNRWSFFKVLWRIFGAPKFTKEFNTLELKWREEILHSLCRAATENHTARHCRLPAGGDQEMVRSISTYVNDRWGRLFICQEIRDHSSRRFYNYYYALPLMKHIHPLIHYLSSMEDWNRILRPPILGPEESISAIQGGYPLHLLHW